jgi:hypothetical protein
MLIVLRARAKARPGNPFTSHLGAIAVAWKVEGEDELLALRGVDGEPPFRTAVLTALDALPTGLAPIARSDTSRGYLFTLRSRGGCTRCGWPLDSEAMFAAAPTCAVCSDGQTRCRRCGVRIGDEGSGWELCSICTPAGTIVL